MTKPNAALDTSRNWGFIDPSVQAKLAGTTVAIAGVGGVGGRIAVELARLGIGGLVLADPDTFSATNLNRQEGSFVSTLGRSKVEVIAALCRDINPSITVAAYTHGVTETNLADFIANADILMEATDYSLPHLGVMLARAARHKGIPMLTGVEIGFGATLAWFPPAGYKYERHLGLKPDVSLGDLQSGKVTVNIARYISHVPAYGDLKVLQEVADGKHDAPAVAPAVGLCSAMAATQIVAIIAGAPTLPPAPAIYSVDVKELRSRIIRHPKAHYRLSLGRVILKSLVHF